ncbi:MAG TPA: nuclear transport factor 2 family protein [Woeseiaceae bacterium]|nr:nuclear transport factor 2 family protein [Woeseiaceae bacterium]
MRMHVLLLSLLLVPLVPQAGDHAGTDAVEAEAEAVAMKMVDAWNTMEWDRMIDLFAEDAVFQSMMKEPVIGRETIRPRFLALVDGIERIELQIRNMAINGNVVFLERVDDFVYKGKHSRIPVVGVLEIADGEVQAWRDYYDWAQLEEALTVEE